MESITEERNFLFKKVASKRQNDLTIVLENIHDPHNIGAVIRTCDAVGIPEIFVLYTEKELKKRGFRAGHKTSSGSAKWIEVNYFNEAETCFEEIKTRFGRILAACADMTSASIYDLELHTPTALLFGNEHEGLTQEALQYADGFFRVPQYGFVESLNISVACAVSLYECLRQRIRESAYSRKFGDHPKDAYWYNAYCSKQEKKRSRGRLL